MDLRYSVLLTVIGFASLTINAFVSQYISKKRINVTRVSMRDSAKLGAATVAGIEMIETIKASGAENGYFKKWSGYQARERDIIILRFYCGKMKTKEELSDKALEHNYVHRSNGETFSERGSRYCKCGTCKYLDIEIGKGAYCNDYDTADYIPMAALML